VRCLPQVVAAIVGAIVLLVIAVILFRFFRGRNPSAKYTPAPFFHRVWRYWKVPNPGARYSLSDGDDHSTAGTARSRRNRMAQTDFEAALVEEQGRTNRQSAASVDRNTSVRSIMTLPAYRQKASEEEHVLGVAGERDGIDVVVEMPTAEDAEAMREDEMEALYQIRLARRRQLAEREARRQARRDARQRNDLVALQDIRDQTRAATANASEEIDDLRAGHERAKQTRQRAVSSVSYADVGIARHDGSRIRANSTESSERVGLLSDAASIALSSQRSPSSLAHRRDRSTSSVLSIDTFHSDSHTQQPGSPYLGGGGGGGRHSSASRSRANSGANTPRLSQTNTRAGSSPELIDVAEADLGDADMPPHSPPGYDDVSLDEITPLHSRSASPYPEPPPDYPGPTEARNQRLSAHAADLADAALDEERQPRRLSRGVGGVPQLPSLRLRGLPQIVIEPSSAVPRDSSR